MELPRSHTSIETGEAEADSPGVFEKVRSWIGQRALKVATWADPSIRWQIEKDNLTGLDRKEVFTQKLEAMLQTGQPVGLFFMDFDNFKLLNTNLGYEGADFVLAAFGQRLREFGLRETDERGRGQDSRCEQGRFGGDEFYVALLLTTRDGGPVADPSAAMENVDQRLGTLIGRFKEVHNLALFASGISRGYAVGLPEQQLPARELITQASERMKTQKQAGKYSSLDT